MFLNVKNYYKSRDVEQMWSTVEQDFVSLYQLKGYHYEINFFDS